ncbi:DUF397 domain-containing protein [Streptomyces klenkii]|uniref:DUF397 domain-containing protein n=1 Tax=Streptomyces klenkii TaxID=1420899 RepID=UPI0033BCB222
MAELDWIPMAEGDETEYLEIAFAGNGDVHIRTNTEPETVVVTTAAKWDAFVLGVRAGEFDHFVEDVPGP